MAAGALRRSAPGRRWAPTCSRSSRPPATRCATYPLLFAEVAAGKRCMALDLQGVHDRARCVELADRAPTSCWRATGPASPPASASGPEQLRAVNPKLVYVSVSGLGATGPLALVPGHDINYVAWSAALTHRNGTPPHELPLPIADLLRRHGRRPGRGGRVDAGRCAPARAPSSTWP